MMRALCLAWIAGSLLGQDGWTELTGESWKPNAWLAVGGASLDPNDPKKLTSTDGKGVILNGKEGKTPNIFSAADLKDVELHVEFMVSKGSNSGVYLMGRYEIQILDSWGVKYPHYSDCSGIYQRWDPKRGKGNEGYEGHAPKVNASKAPGEWQTFDIVFRAPRFDAAGKKTSPARFVKVTHNGQVVHENVEVTGTTRAGAWEEEKPEGPIMLQGDHGPVAFRALRYRALPPEGK